jgi:hypothetical protein
MEDNNINFSWKRMDEVTNKVKGFICKRVVLFSLNNFLFPLYHIIYYRD